MTLRAVVVGCGFIGASEVSPVLGVQSHAAAWAKHPGTRLAGLCDTDPSRLAVAASRWEGVPTFTDLDRLLTATRPDIVSVCTPDETHVGVLERVLAHRSVRAVLAEKPLALDADTAERIVAEAEARGVLVAVNYGRRSTPSHRALRDWLATGAIGAIEVVRGVYVGGVKHNGTHWLDLARFLVGEISAVRGTGLVPPGGGDATIDVALAFASGARGLLLGVATARYSLFEMDLLGTSGRLRITEGGHRFEAFRSIESDRFPGFRELAPCDGPPGGLVDLLLHAAVDLVDALESGRPPGSTGADAVAALRLAEEAMATTLIEDRHDAPVRC